MFVKDVNANSSIILLTANKFCQDNIKINALHIGSALENQLIEGTLEHYSNSTVKQLRNQCFRGMTTLITATFDKVESIGATCFTGCENLESITIKTDGVATIPNSTYIVNGKTITIYVPFLQINNYLANANWKALFNYDRCVFKPYETDHVIKDNIYYMYLNTSTVVDLMGYQGVTTIKSKAFNDSDYNKVSVKYVKIPPSVTTIEDGAFNTEDKDLIIYGYYGTAAETYARNNGIQFIALDLEVNDDGIVTKFNPQPGNQTLLKDIIIPDKITKLNDDGTISEINVVGIGEKAFQTNLNITTLVLPNTVASIGWAAFEGCANLKKVTLSNSESRSELHNIGSFAFRNCVNLIEFFSFEPSSPKDELILGQGAFESCSSLTKLQIEYINVNMNNVNNHFNNHNTDFTIYCYENSTIYNYAKSNNIKIRSLNYITNESNELIRYTGSLTDLEIPNDITGIADVNDNEHIFDNYDTITSVIMPASITKIGSRAFSQCKNLETITLPQNTITTVGSYAFNECLALSKLTMSYLNIKEIPEGMFYGCENLTNISFDNFTKIGDKAFMNCTSLLAISGNGSIKTIGEQAFSECGTLQTATSLIADNSSIGNEAFYNCTALQGFTLKSGTIIGDYTFYGCSEFSIINNSEGATSIGSGAFAKTAIEEFTVNSNITIINPYVFYECASLQKVKLQDGLTSIGKEAFYGCKKIQSINTALGNNITIPNTIEILDENAFYGCSGLSIANLSGLTNLTSIGKSAFKGCTDLQTLALPFVGNTKNGTENTHFGYIFGASGYASNEDCIPTSLKSVTIEGGTIANYAFYYCSNITDIEVSDINSIGKSAFEGCDSLDTLILPFVGNTKNGTTNTHFGYIFGASGTNNNNAYIPTSLKSVTIEGGDINDYAFGNCKNITTINIGEDVEYIGYYILSNNNISSIYFDINFDTQTTSYVVDEMFCKANELHVYYYDNDKHQGIKNAIDYAVDNGYNVIGHII